MPMTPRERYVATLTFGRPDRIPFAPGGPRESTRAAWRTQGLGADVPWHAHLARTLDLPDMRPERPPGDLGVDFRLIPQFEEKVLERRQGHLVVQDWKGNVCEIDDRYDVTYLREAKDFVTRRWIRCPVEGPEDWSRMKTRYALDAPGRFADDFPARAARAGERDAPLVIRFSGPFWQMREWWGFEGLCLAMIEQPDLVDEMAAFWTEFVLAMLERTFAEVVPDAILVNEDLAYKAHAMISPAMVRRFCMPSWRQWAASARKAGVPIVDIDSDGYVGELVPLWIEAGANVCHPMEVAAHNDLPACRAEYGRRMAYHGGVDKRAIAAGGERIEAELARLAPVVADGGYIPGCDHGVPADVAWPDFVHYARRLAEMTGWL